MKIGFVGLGIMGKPMAKNLMAAGYDLVVNTLDDDVIAEFEEEGAVSAPSAADVAEQVDLLITMLPNSPQVKEVALGEGGIIEKAKEGLIYVDMSSIAPLASREVGEALAEKGVKMLDAPVSGGEPKAIDGSLAVMVGGEEEVFDKVKEILGVMASSVTLVGPLGAGNIAKLANQTIVAVNIAAVAEAYMLSKKAGVDPKSVYQAIRSGLAGSTVMDQKSQKIFDGDWAPGFRINLHIKDLNNVLQTGHEFDSPLPLTSLVRDMMTVLKGDDAETDDHCALAKVYEKLANTDLRSDSE